MQNESRTRKTVAVTYIACVWYWLSCQLVWALVRYIGIISKTMGLRLLNAPPKLHQHGKNLPLNEPECSSCCSSRPKLHNDECSGVLHDKHIICKPDHWAIAAFCRVARTWSHAAAGAFCFIACRVTVGSASPSLDRDCSKSNLGTSLSSTVVSGGEGARFTVEPASFLPLGILQWGWVFF